MSSTEVTYFPPTCVFYCPLLYPLYICALHWYPENIIMGWSDKAVNTHGIMIKWHGKKTEAVNKEEQGSCSILVDINIH